ncbi:MAG: SoxR reducing system RseC family protein [Chromatiales bacterium]|nr:SoxR reducing system RseC family protein [Chromatiales bacterium]
MPNNSNKQFCIDKPATVVNYENGIATVRLDIDGGGCESCSDNKKSGCALYNFGAIFSPPRDTWQLPARHPLAAGERVRLVVQSSVLLKIAASCYALPIAVFMSSAVLTHLLSGTEWLTITVATSSLVLSYLITKKQLRSITTNINVIR